jgi:hypothetical protein
VIAEGINCRASDFHIFTGGVVTANACLHFVAHGLLNGALAGDGRAASSFSTATGRKRIATMTCFDSAEFSCAFTPS